MTGLVDSQAFGPVFPIISADIFTAQRRGGISRYFAELHRGLRGLGIQSRIVAPVWQSEHLRCGPGVTGVPLHSLSSLRGGPRLATQIGAVAERAALSLQNRRHGAIVLHRSYYTKRPCPPGIVRVETVYDMIHEDHPNMYRRRPEIVEAKRAAVLAADAVIAISEYTRNRLLARTNLDPSKVVSVHLAVSHMEPDVATKAQLERSMPFILYVGERAGYKNFSLFLFSLEPILMDNRDIKVVAFGGSSPTVAEFALIDSLRLRSRVEFMTGSDSILAAYYSAALFFVYPSTDEGFGLPPLEAMAQGCPVVSSNAGPMPEVLGSAVVYVNPFDVESMHCAMEQVLQDEALRRQLSSDGLTHCKNYSWETTARSTLNVYRQAIDRR